VARYQAGIRTEGRIVEATRQLLGEVGLEGTTLKAICERAEVRAGSFYNLFESKEEVVLRIVKEAIRAVDPRPSGGGDDSLAELVEAYISFITGESTLARVYLKIAISGAVRTASAPGWLGTTAGAPSASPRPWPGSIPNSAPRRCWRTPKSSSPPSTASPSPGW